MADKRIVTVDYLNSEGLNKDYINNSFANALKGSKHDTAMLIDDVSPITHDMGVKVRSKNLIPYPYINTTKEVNGITFTVNDDRSITISGKAEKNAYFYLCTVDFGSNNMWNETANSNGYYVSGCKHFFYNGNNKASVILVPSGTDYSTNPLTVKPQIELGTTATAYTPYVPDLTVVKVSRYGKNLLNPSLYLNTATFQGIKYTTNGDTITLTGTAKASSYVNIFSSNPDAVIPLPSILKNKKIKLYAYGNSYTVELLIRKTTGANTVSANNNQSIDTTGATGFSIRCRFVSGNTYNDSIKFMITEEGVENNTEYEPYIAPTEYTPTADGTVNGVTSLYPNTTLMTDTDGVLIDCEYNRDINKAFAELQQAIISLGGNV